MNDVARSVRLLARHPRYTLLAIFTLAAGVGVTASMFALLDALFFRPLPIADPQRLVDLSIESPANRFGTFSYEEFREIERDAPGFKDVFAIGQRGVTLNRNGETSLLLIHYVSGRYFPSLQIPMQMGRGFVPADDRAELETPQVVINHLLWQQLGSPSDIVGRTVQLNKTPFTVIGVTAPGFVGLGRFVRTDVWVTISQAPFVVPGLRDEITNRQQRWFRITGRLADGADPAQARAGLDVVAARWRAADARAYADAKILVGSQERHGAAQRAGSADSRLVGLVLLIACANVANLTLARANSDRASSPCARRSAPAAPAHPPDARGERALSAGAGRRRAGGRLAGALFPALLPPGTSAIVLDIRMDGRFFAFTAALAVAPPRSSASCRHGADRAPIRGRTQDAKRPPPGAA